MGLSNKTKGVFTNIFGLILMTISTCSIIALSIIELPNEYKNGYHIFIIPSILFLFGLFLLHKHEAVIEAVINYIKKNSMELEVIRFSHQSDSTIGFLKINLEYECYTLEDEYRAKKVKHETRIPDGRYKIAFRKEGGFNNRYTKKFANIEGGHQGMLQVLNVPGFDYILIHCGNDDDDTSGCLLLGNSANNNRISSGFIGNSVQAYESAYPKIAKALLSGEPVNITYKSI